MFKVLLLLVSLLLACSAASFAGSPVEASGKQTTIAPLQASPEKAPLVVIYTVSSCTHCQEAKEYLTRNQIPFANREVDTDDGHMEELMKIYASMGVPDEKRGVPLFVIGNRIRIQGFNKEKLLSALKEAGSKPK